MIYKGLKRDQISQLKKDGQYTEMMTAIVESDLNAFKDLRNLLFDRELGTNLLSEFVTNDASDFDKLLSIMDEVKR